MFLGEKRIGNFKPGRTAKAEAKAAHDPRAEREGNCEKHLAAIRKCPCCVPGCNKVGVDPHHLKETGERGMGMRSPDRYTVPMCRYPHHEAIEKLGSKKELAWFKAHGIDALQLAGDLWSAPQVDAAVYTAIVLAHKAAAGKLTVPK